MLHTMHNILHATRQCAFEPVRFERCHSHTRCPVPGVSWLRKNSMLYLILGGAALQRCNNWRVFINGFSRAVPFFAPLASPLRTLRLRSFLPQSKDRSRFRNCTTTTQDYCGRVRQAGEAGRIVPRQLPNPMRRNPSRSQNPRRMISSPSSRNFLCSPVGSVTGSWPREVSSNRHPRAVLSGT